jgi:hypothetical protein
MNFSYTGKLPPSLALRNSLEDFGNDPERIIGFLAVSAVLPFSATAMTKSFQRLTTLT